MEDTSYWLNFWQILISLLDILVWPSVVVTIILLFRKPALALLLRSNSVTFRHGNSAIEFEAKKAQQNQYSETSLETQTPDVMKELLKENKKIRSRYEKKIKIVTKNKEEVEGILIEQILLRDVQLEFERIHNMIFGSQLELLERIGMHTGSGVDSSYLNSYYDKVKEVFSYFEDWEVDDYLSFLFKSTLLAQDTSASKVMLTQKGKSFLAYIKERGYLSKPF